MDVADVQRVVDAFLTEYKGHIPLRFTVNQTQEEAYGPQGSNPVVVKGGYHSTGGRKRLADPDHGGGGLEAGRVPGASADVQRAEGRVVLIADNLRDEADVLETLRHEVLGHFGLNTFPPEVNRKILDAIAASRSVPGMRRIWVDIDRRYSDMDESYRAEEVFAWVTENEAMGNGEFFINFSRGPAAWKFC